MQKSGAPFEGEEAARRTPPDVVPKAKVRDLLIPQLQKRADAIQVDYAGDGKQVAGLLMGGMREIAGGHRSVTYSDFLDMIGEKIPGVRTDPLFDMAEKQAMTAVIDKLGLDADQKTVALQRCVNRSGIDHLLRSVRVQREANNPDYSGYKLMETEGESHVFRQVVDPDDVRLAEAAAESVNKDGSNLYTPVQLLIGARAVSEELIASLEGGVDVKVPEQVMTVAERINGQGGSREKRVLDLTREVLKISAEHPTYIYREIPGIMKTVGDYIEAKRDKTAAFMPMDLKNLSIANVASRVGGAVWLGLTGETSDERTGYRLQTASDPKRMLEFFLHPTRRMGRDVAERELRKHERSQEAHFILLRMHQNGVTKTLQEDGIRRFEVDPSKPRAKTSG